MGTWDSKSKTLAMPEPNMFERRKDLSGTVLINSVLHYKPFCILSEDSNGIVKATGYFPSLLANMQKAVRVFSVFYSLVHQFIYRR